MISHQPAAYRMPTLTFILRKEIDWNGRVKQCDFSTSYPFHTIIHQQTDLKAMPKLPTNFHFTWPFIKTFSFIFFICPSNLSKPFIDLVKKQHRRSLHLVSTQQRSNEVACNKQLTYFAPQRAYYFQVSQPPALCTFFHAKSSGKHLHKSSFWTSTPSATNCSFVPKTRHTLHNEYWTL